ncbi:MAG: carbohydrate binding domain-containing protein, partial [Clostridium sp.]|nr:carbohydrate binding domain-containing protein [Clostridium sp.]
MGVNKKRLLCAAMAVMAMIVVVIVIRLNTKEDSTVEGQPTDSTSAEISNESTDSTTQEGTQTESSEQTQQTGNDTKTTDADGGKYGENLLINAGFEDGDNAWYATGGTLEIINDASLASQGSSFAYISGRNDNWNCIAQNVTQIIEDGGAGKMYYIAFDVKLSSEYTTNGVTQQQVQFKTTRKDSNDSINNYDVDLTSGCTAMANTDTWTTVEGFIVPTWDADLETYEYKMAEQPSGRLADGTYGAYYVDNAKLQEYTPADAVISE